MEAEEKREKSVRKMKKNLKLLMIALVVLAIEKLSEFFTALFSGSGSPASEDCKCNNSVQLNWQTGTELGNYTVQ